jgi:hypothetical protein
MFEMCMAIRSSITKEDKASAMSICKRNLQTRLEKAKPDEQPNQSSQVYVLVFTAPVVVSPPVSTSPSGAASPSLSETTSNLFTSLLGMWSKPVSPPPARTVSMDTPSVVSPVSVQQQDRPKSMQVTRPVSTKPNLAGELVVKDQINEDEDDVPEMNIAVTNNRGPAIGGGSRGGGTSPTSRKPSEPPAVGRLSVFLGGKSSLLSEADLKNDKPKEFTRPRSASKGSKRTSIAVATLSKSAKGKLGTSTIQVILDDE